MSLLNIDTNAKTIKGQKQGYMTGILYLAPHTIAGIGNLCPDATEGCRAGCLYTAGRGVFNNVQTARIAKTRRFKADRAGFMAELVKDIAALVRKATRAGMIPVVRLNGTSDLPWENIPALAHNAWPSRSLMELFPDVQFYDYTKSARRMLASLGAGFNWPLNYHLTFSRSECNDTDARLILARGGNVAVVFSTRKGDALPATWGGHRVVNGDESDLRFTDVWPGYLPSTQAYEQRTIRGGGLVVGLYAKGKARKDTSGFVVTETEAHLNP